MYTNLLLFHERAIGALSSDPDRELELRHKIDHIISDAAEFGILFRPTAATNLKFDNVYDLSCLSFPVARAACRYVLMKRIMPQLQSHIENRNETTEHGTTSACPTMIPDLRFITGSGLQHRIIKNGSNNLNIRSSSDSIGIHQSRSMFLREYTQYILLNDFGLNSLITADRTFGPTATKSTVNLGNVGDASINAVTIKVEALWEWCTKINE